MICRGRDIFDCILFSRPVALRARAETLLAQKVKTTDAVRGQLTAVWNYRGKLFPLRPNKSAGGRRGSTSFRLLTIYAI
jgi:hypothetical protein